MFFSLFLCHSLHFSLRLKFQQQKTFWIDRFRFFYCSPKEQKKSLQRTIDDESVEREKFKTLKSPKPKKKWASIIVHVKHIHTYTLDTLRVTKANT